MDALSTRQVQSSFIILEKMQKKKQQKKNNSAICIWATQLSKIKCIYDIEVAENALNSPWDFKYNASI